MTIFKAALIMFAVIGYVVFVFLAMTIVRVLIDRK